VRDHIGFKGAFAVVGQVLNNSVSKSAWHWMSLSVKWFVDVGSECDDDCGCEWGHSGECDEYDGCDGSGCDYERRCEPRCQPGHFFLRRKLPLPRPTREGCTALEAICCLVDAAERGALLDELSLEAEDDFTPFAAEFDPVVAPAEFPPAECAVEFPR